MRKMKRFAALALTVVMGLSLVACGKDDDKKDSGSNGGNETATEAQAEVKTTVVDTGEIKAVVPEGWTGLQVHDMFSDDPEAKDPEQLQIIKGGTTAEDAWKCNFIQVYYSAPGKELASAKDFYEDAKDIEPFEKGGYSWTGYTCSSMGYEYTIIEGKKGEESLQLSILTKNGEQTISFDDTDVQFIIENITTTPPATTEK